MIRFLLKKLLRVAANPVGVTLITFLLIHAIPGSPWSNYSGTPRAMTGTQIDQVFSARALPAVRIGSATVAAIYPLHHRRL